MGAQYDSGSVEIRKDQNIESAFAQLTDDKAWEHGHGGYSGSLAEKRGKGFVLVARVNHVDLRTVADLLEGWDDATLAEEADWMRLGGLVTLAKAREVASDKWGPAAAVEVAMGDGKRMLFAAGMCSS